VEIEVVEPVSGNIWQRGVAKAAVNLAHCDNIKKATVVVGGYRQNPFSGLIGFFVNFFHWLFCRGCKDKRKKEASLG